ncbi:uncharacterized protein LOC129595762 [Paramacrobiotus metropolitanus]|uniref:uncharacterized protein LOC129595762 n=1 Tax=Paramacrobiotus metropolitanus TaxID=2943436 RepID=UPI0024463181|nr:uncharacterized protein LOC129595762 [Paramacrobiotus metropolitanus]
MRETPSGPWRWYPAEMVNLARGAQYESYNVAIVHWGATVARTDIVLGEPIRRRDPSHWGTAAAGKRIEKETFAKAGMPLPKAYCSLSAKELRRLMPSYRLDCAGWWMWSFAFVDIVDDHLWYIERPRTERAAGGNFLDELLDFSPAALHSILFDHFARTFRLPKPTTVELENQESHDVSTVLSGELWLEVFSQLGTLPRTLLRTVCQMFACLLDSPTLSADIFITTADCDQMENYDRRDYFVVAPIYQCLSSSTKRIIVADRKTLLSDSDIWKVLDMIHYVAERRPQLRRLALYFFGFRCSFELGLTCDSRMEHGNCVLHGPKPLQQNFNGIPEASLRCDPLD